MLEGISKLSLDLASPSKQVQLDGTAQGLIQTSFDSLQGCRLYLPGPLLQCLITLRIIFFLISSQIFPWCNLHYLLVTSLFGSKRSLSFLQPWSASNHCIQQLHLPLLSLRLNNFTPLSLSSYIMCSRGHLGGLCWTHSSVSESFLCQKAPSLRQCPRGAGNNHCPWLPGYTLAITVQCALGLMCHKNTLLSPFQLPVYWALQGFFLHHCFLCSHGPAVWLGGVILSHLQDFALAFTETHEFPVSPLYQPIEIL